MTPDPPGYTVRSYAWAGLAGVQADPANTKTSAEEPVVTRPGPLVARGVLRPIQEGHAGALQDRPRPYWAYAQ